LDTPRKTQFLDKPARLNFHRSVGKMGKKEDWEKFHPKFEVRWENTEKQKSADRSVTRKRKKEVAYRIELGKTRDRGREGGKTGNSDGDEHGAYTRPASRANKFLVRVPNRDQRDSPRFPLPVRM